MQICELTQGIIIGITTALYFLSDILAMTGCTSGSLRLNGGSENEGNLQICTNGTWLQVIYSNWDSLDGEVACRELGLLHSGGTSELIMSCQNSSSIK